MSRRLWERVGTLMRADAHGVVDALEERGLLVRQHVRDAEVALLEKRARLEELEREAERLRASVENLRERHTGLDADVERALEGGSDAAHRSLARFAARRWLAVGRDLAALAAREAAVEKERVRLAGEVETQGRALTDLQARARAFEAGTARPEPEAAASVADEEVELELLRRRGMRPPAGRTAASAPGARGPDATPQEDSR